MEVLNQPLRLIHTEFRSSKRSAHMFEKSSRCGKRNKIRNGGFLCGKLKENVKYSNKKRMSTFCVSFSTIYCNKTLKICKFNFFEHRDRSKLEYRGLYKSSKQVFSYTKLASHQITKVPSKNIKANIKVKGKNFKNTIYCPVISDTIVLIVILVILVFFSLVFFGDSGDIRALAVHCIIQVVGSTVPAEYSALRAATGHETLTYGHFSKNDHCFL